MSKFETVVVEFTDEELLKYMMMAHEMDITLNQFINRALAHMIEQDKKRINGTQCASFCGDPACIDSCLTERKHD
jgi:hypothetical protein